MKDLAVTFAVAAMLLVPAFAADKPPATEQDKTLYALGLLMSRSVDLFTLTAPELARVQQGFADGVLGRKPQLDAQAYMPKVQELQATRAKAAEAVTIKAGTAFLEAAAKQPGATRSATGLVLTTLTAGTGAAPTATSQVKVHYEGKLIDGTVFDSSIKRGEPAVFPLSGVIPCWTEALQLMKVGGKARVICPPSLAYAERGAPPLIHPGATLVFEVQLLEIVK